MDQMSVSPSTQQYLPPFLLGGSSGVGGGSSSQSNTMMMMGGGLDQIVDVSPSSPTSPQVSSQLGQSIAGLNDTLDYIRSQGSPYSNAMRGGQGSYLSPLNSPDYGKRSRRTRDGRDGPPTASLFDDLPVRATPVSLTPSNTLSGGNTHKTPNKALDKSLIPEDEKNTGFWVLVFGFPPSYALQILGLFTQIGRVMEQNFPNIGNWFFIKYPSKMEVRKALAFNEKIVCGNIMIGVSERPGYPQMQSPLNRSGMSEEMKSPNRHMYTSPGSGNKLRNLGVVTTPENRAVDSNLIPKKETGIVSKAMDLLFGW